MKKYKSNIFILIKIITFYFITLLISQFVIHELRNFLHGLSMVSHSWKTIIDTFEQLDYGRMVGRLGRFVGVLFVFFFYTKFFDQVSLQDSVLNPKTSKIKFFIYGAVLGAIMVGITIILTIISKSIVFQFSPDWIQGIFPTFILYLFAMIMTATTEELIVRGYILNNLLKMINPNVAIVMTSILFGYWHWNASFIYAWMAFIFGLIAGYGFIWTKNLYFCIGIHFSWNFIESVVYSKSIFFIDIVNPFLAGSKNITPDQEGVLSLPALFIGLIILIILYKNKRRHY